LPNRDIQFIKGVGPARARVLQDETGIETIEDLLYYPPRRYLDRSSFKSIRDCFVSETVTVAGTIAGVNLAGKNRRYLEVTIDDGTDTLSGIFFAGLRYFQKVFITGDFVLFSGKVDFYNRKQIVHPDFDFLDEDSSLKSINTGRVVPLYRSTENLKASGFDSRGFRRIIRYALDHFLSDIHDPMDGKFLERLSLMPLRDAIFKLHFPETLQSAEEARRRLSFNELYFLQYYLDINRKLLREEFKGTKSPIDPALYRDFLGRLPFELTGDQKKSIADISADLANPFPMNRMLQGDVGSGKTIVAMAASLMAVGRSCQTAVMSPTEILAIQHHRNFAGLMPEGVRIALLTGSTPPAEKKLIYRDTAEGKIHILIGTHALIQNEVSFKNLGLIVIDEQHRFGVHQRAKLREKGNSADLLIMTATPIPRSLSLTLYGDLDVSLIRDKRAAMIPVKTMAFPRSRIKGVYNSVEKYMAEGRQAFFVLPLIEESEKSDLKSAKELFAQLRKEVFPHRSIELLHGKLPAAEKEAVMRTFRNGETDILVSTTVIEVGIDVPNASVMVIEHAERFGLSQLHQLRGRVGRGSHQSFCVLVYPDDVPAESRRRIETLVELDDGFKIAEEDLKLRGAGEIIGSRQHGYNSGFEFTDLAADLDLILSAREEATRAVSKIENVSTAMSDLRGDVRNIEMLKGIRKKRILAILS